MVDIEIKKATDKVIETIHHPTNLATGDAISMLVETTIRKNVDVDNKIIVEMLQKAGFDSAYGLKDFISTQIRYHRNRYKKTQSNP